MNKTDDAINDLKKSIEYVEFSNTDAKDIEHLISIIGVYRRTFNKIQEMCVNAERSEVPHVNLERIRQVAKVALDKG